MSLAHLLYVSTASQTMTRDDLRKIIDISVVNNKSAGITGILLYSAGNFMQLLEGDMYVINDLFRRLERDTRHKDVMLLTYTAVQSRIFAQWHMGLLNAEDLQPVDRERLAEMIERTRRIEDQQCPAIQLALDLLREFRQQLPHRTAHLQL